MLLRTIWLQSEGCMWRHEGGGRRVCLFWPCVRRDFFLMQINVSYKHVETCGAYADSRAEWVRGRRAWQSQKPPQPPPPPPTVSQSIDVNEFGADAFHFIYFFLLFWRLCKGDESWGGVGGGGEGKITKATCIWRLAALSAARRENCWLNLM